MSFIYSLTDTWNAIGTTFNSILMNVSNGAGGAPVGAAASRILNLQNNSATVLDVDVNGLVDNRVTLVGATNEFTIRNLDNTNALSSVFVFIRAGGASGGDPAVRFNIPLISNWTIGLDNSDSDRFKISANSVLGLNDCLTGDSTGSIILNNAAILTTATDGFLYIPTCAGAPTGVPTAYTGRIPMIYDTTNDQFWFYRAGWKQPKTPAGAAIVTWQ